MTIHILYGINNEDDSRELLGYFTSKIILSDTKHELSVRSDIERKIKKKWKVIEQEYENLLEVYSSGIVYPAVPKKLNNIKTQDLIEYLKLQIEKGNIEQAEATRAEIRGIEARNVEIRRTNRQNIDEYNYAYNELRENVRSQIRRIMGNDKYEFYIKYTNYSYKIFDSYEEEHVEADVLLIKD